MHSQSDLGFPSHNHTSDWRAKGIEMAKKANGQGYTYKVGNSYRTVIRNGDHSITAMAKNAQDSRKLAKEKLVLKVSETDTERETPFLKSPIPPTIVEYRDYKDASIRFVTLRNARISDWSKNGKAI